MDGEETPGVVFGVCVALLCFFRFVCFSIYRRVKTEGFEHKLKVGSLLFFPLFACPRYSKIQSTMEMWLELRNKKKFQILSMGNRL